MHAFVDMRACLRRHVSVHSYSCEREYLKTAECLVVVISHAQIIIILILIIVIIIVIFLVHMYRQ